MTRRGVILVVALVIGALLAWWGAERVYLRPARELRGEIAEKQHRIEEIDRMLEGRGRVQASGDALGATMFAGEMDEVEHTLRVGITEVARGAGLRELSLGNGAGSGVTSPVIAAMRRSALGRALRERADFNAVPAWVMGTGDLRQVLTALGSLQAQAWVHRVDSFSIKPVDEHRRVFRLRVDFTTIVSGDVPRGVRKIESVAAMEEGGAARIGAIVEANPFASVFEMTRVETPAEVAPVQVRDPLRAWRLTGLVERGREVEALLVNSSSKERAVLGLGGAVEGATFEGGGGERAVFELAGELHEVRVGQSLGDRRAVPRATVDGGQER